MKTTMGGQGGALIDRLRSAVGLVLFHFRNLSTRAQWDVAFHQQPLGIIHDYWKGGIDACKILEIGCGQRATQTLLFAADGANVVGIDMEVPTYKMDVWKFFKLLHKNGLGRAFKSLIRHVLFDAKYYRKLAVCYGKKIPLQKVDVRVMDATDLLFPDNYFDFVISAATFEHIECVESAAAEIGRVLKPSGIVWIGVHLFPSISGGHHLDWSSPDRVQSKKVPPWDHLQRNSFPVNVYLNKLRLAEYRRIFRKHFNVLREELQREGENLLSPELEFVLSCKGFTREDLTTRWVTFVGRKITAAVAS